MAGVAAVGWSVPHLHVEAGEVAKVWGRFGARGVERVGVAAFDQDAVTFAVEAGERALEAWGGARQDVDLVVLATNHHGPGPGATVAEALGLQGAGPEVLRGGAAAGVQALGRARDHADATGLPVLVVASDAPRGRPDDPATHGLSAGAAAFLVHPTEGATVGGLVASHRESPGADRTTMHGFVERKPLADRSGEALRDVLDRVHPVPGEARVACAAPAGPLRDQVAGDLVRVEPKLGEVPAAGPLLSLAEALGSGVGPVLVAGAGQGVAAATTMAPEAPVPGAGGVLEALEASASVPYHRFLRERELLPPHPPEEEQPMGAYVSLPDHLATLDARYRLTAARCEACEDVVFPPRPTCQACGSHGFAEVELPGGGEVYSTTVIGRGGAPSEFSREQAMTGAYAVAVVQLDGPNGEDGHGLRVVARLTDRDPTAWSIGDPVEAVFRKLYAQEGVTRYGLKFRDPAQPPA